MAPNVQHKQARKIGATHRSASGTHPPAGHYDPTLEQDLIEIVSFDPNMERYLSQPMTIDYIDVNGQTREYTPDGLILFIAEASNVNLPIICEVKYRSYFHKDWRNHLRKFRAAKRYAMDTFREFRVFTETEIRGPYLENIRFLKRYVDYPIEPEIREWILEILWDLLAFELDAFLHCLQRDERNRARLIGPIWRMVYEGQIGCDLSVPLTSRTVIWPKVEL